MEDDQVKSAESGAPEESDSSLVALSEGGVDPLLSTTNATISDDEQPSAISTAVLDEDGNVVEVVEPTPEEKEITEVEAAQVEVNRPVVYYPDPILERVAEPVPVNQITSDFFQTLIEDMEDTMNVSKGIGIAAPQVGCSFRIFLTKIPTKNPDDAKVKVYINPVVNIQNTRKRAMKTEGCLSFPTMLIRTNRFHYCTITAYNRDGEQFQEMFTGLEGQVVQHEENHLDGITLFTRMRDIDKVINRRGLRALRHIHKLKLAAAAKAKEEAEKAVVANDEVPGVVEQADLY